MIIASIGTAAALTFGLLGGPGADAVIPTVPTPVSATHVLLAGDSNYPGFCRWFDRNRHDWRCDYRNDSDHHGNHDHGDRNRGDHDHDHGDQRGDRGHRDGGHGGDHHEGHR